MSATLLNGTTILACYIRPLYNRIFIFQKINPFPKINPKKEYRKTLQNGFKLEDVLFTGILRQKAKLAEPRDASGTCLHLGQTSDPKNSLNSHMLEYCLAHQVEECTQTT